MLTYSVTAILTNDATFRQEGGAVIIRDEFGNLVADDAHYTIVSHGENSDIPCDARRSFFVQDGNTLDEANTNLQGAPDVEIENCDEDDVFVSGLLNRTNNAAQQYDDEIRYARAADISYWGTVRRNSTFTDVRNLDLSNGMNDTRVGIGINVPQERLDVAGEIRVDRLLRSRKICNKDGSKCVRAVSYTHLTLPTKA